MENGKFTEVKEEELLEDLKDCDACWCLNCQEKRKELIRELLDRKIAVISFRPIRIEI